MPLLLKTLTPLVLLIGLAGGGLSYWIGGQLARFNDQQARLGANTLTMTEFERGWRHSSSTAALDFADPTLPSLDLRLRLDHGLLSGKPLRIITEPDPTNPWCDRFLADCATTASQLVSRLDWRGGQQHQLNLTELSLPPTAHRPSLHLSDLSGSLQLAPRNRAGELQLRSAHASLGPQALDASDLAMRFLLDGPYLQLNLDLQARRLVLTEQLSGTIELSASAERLAASALATLLKADAMVGVLLAWQELLLQKPLLSLERLRWQGEQGELHARAELTLQAINPLRWLRGGGPLSLIERGSGELTVARDLAEQLLTLWLSLQQPVAREVARNRLREWQEAGFVSLDNNVYHLRFHIGQQGLFLNDVGLAGRQ